MTSEDILARLKENEAAPRARGVLLAALFGSRARGDNRPGSDIDMMMGRYRSARLDTNITGPI
jgi:predicted nucleotidyltransferase